MNSFKELEIKGVYLVENFVAQDRRGTFVKTIHKDKLQEIGFTDEFRESYYSLSVKNVIRGMHFQRPPHDHEKLVYVTAGKILDVILDLRTSSSTYGKSIAVELSEFSYSVYIPKGCAHGFLTLSDTATVVYNVTTVYNKEADDGIRWNSFGFDWPVTGPVLSDRDLSFKTLQEQTHIFP
jgi:dTDP-4-dehydrorhamnose 3,5-epimerase/CDP-3, 6-dideoxy-D-glycero-D-glycero-4-hexulose-5-epimerase